MASLGFRWTVVSAADYPEIARGDAPAGFLSPEEARALAKLLFPERRRKWLLGRLAAKTLIADETGASFMEITIGNDPSGAPYAEMAGEGRIGRVISISHRAQWGLAAIGDVGVTALGVDMEITEARTDFTGDFFTPREIAAVDRAGAERDLAIARTWSAKEAALKALGVGLRIDTRAIEVGDVGGESVQGWTPVRISTSGGVAFAGPARAYWQRGPGYVMTAVVVGKPG